MKKLFLSTLAALLLYNCATYEAQVAESTVLNNENDSSVAHTFYLIGDAGKSPLGDLNPVLKSFKEELGKAGANSTAIFLGDNIYPSGLPSAKGNSTARGEAINNLDAQISAVDGFNGKTIFLPGNHDWYNGLKGVKRQQKYLEEKLGDGVFLPEDGCPLKRVKISDDIVVIAIDTEWYLTNWDDYPDINEGCELKNRGRFLAELSGLIKKNADKTTILAMHHPIYSYGPHGGQYSAKQQLHPTGDGLPLPVIGTLANVLRKTSGASRADMQNKRYNSLIKRVATMAQFSQKVIVVSGHEHSLQYIVENNIPQIVSGSGAKTSAARLINGSQFAAGKPGYAVLKVYDDGSSAVEFKEVNGNGTQSLFSTQVKPPNRAKKPFNGPATFPEFVEASVYTDDEVDVTGFHKFVWGDRYRSYYGTKVKAKTVDLDTLYGGLKPVRRGGGNQSKSLRLEDKDGRYWVMRALKKSAERYLQALAFQESYIVGKFQGTATEALLQDFYTGSHPYAPFTIGTLSDAVGVYHTNPRLFYIPKQKALEEYNDQYGNELYMIEEHVSDGHDIASFGNTKKILSTNDLFEKLRKDEDFKIDTEAYVKARVFDMLIGDWDRHQDQWRWAEFKDGKGHKTYKPIPRDRDQAFSIMGDGALMGFATRAIPSLRLFEGYRPEIRNVKGFNSEGALFALDMALLPESTLEQWKEQAKFIQSKITPSLIDRAFEYFPEEVRDETIAEIKDKLMSRSQRLVHTAEEYFKVINKYSVITGTDKDDHFVITCQPTGEVDVKLYRIKGGQKSDLFFSKLYKPAYTKELWIYGLDDKDVFEVKGRSKKIKIKIAGGHDNDSYKIADRNGKVKVYDQKSKKNTYDEAFGGKIKKVDDYETNTYQFEKIRANNNQIIPTLGANPDDGFRIGFNNTYTVNGFRKNPFSHKHVIDAAYYFSTSGYEIGYLGEFANIFENTNLEINARFNSPNYAQNFFGFGNETPNFDDDLDFDFNRVRIRRFQFAPSLVWRGDLGSKIHLGVSYEDYDVENTADRFIRNFINLTNLETDQSFMGVEAGYAYANYDNLAYPTLGMNFSLRGGYKVNLTTSDRSFAYLIPDLSIDYKISSDGRLVLVTRWQGHINLGDDFEFYQGAKLGANNGLRGFRNERFTGKQSFFQQTDLRYSFRERRTGLLPVTPGIYGGFDYGRVWIPNGSSDQWHTSPGGGLFLNMAGYLSANVGVFGSDDGARFAFRLGFDF